MYVCVLIQIHRFSALKLAPTNNNHFKVNIILQLSYEFTYMASTIPQGTLAAKLPCWLPSQTVQGDLKLIPIIV